MIETFKLREVLRYTKYDTETGIVILVNDVLNLHLRTFSIDQLTVSTTPDRTTVAITTKMDERTIADGGRYYTGDVSVIFDKLDVALVYPDGFSVQRWMGIDSILSTLLNRTGVKINKEECDIVESGGTISLVFKETSVFWKGIINIKINDLPIIVDVNINEYNPDISEIISGTHLDGFIDD